LYLNMVKMTLLLIMSTIMFSVSGSIPKAPNYLRMRSLSERL